MCTLTDLVDHIKGCRINDDEKCPVWKDEVIKKTLREALCEVMAIRPDLFGINKEVNLKAGECYQSFCDDCCRVLQVVYINGQPCERIEEEADEDHSLDPVLCYFEDENCAVKNCDDKTVSDYEPGTFDIDEFNRCAFWLENAPTEDFTATITCVPDLSDIDCDADLPKSVCTELKSGIIDNALSRLYAIDHGDAYQRELAAYHSNRYSDFTNLKLVTDFSLLENNYLLGRRRSDDYGGR